MTNLEIIDSGWAQFTKRQKLLYMLETGLAESNDQDKYVYDLERGIFAVADGAGGVLNGEKAAQAACDAFYVELRERSERESITTNAALYIAQSSLAKIIHTAAGETAGVTTFTGIYRLNDNRYAYLHAGDSELLRYRRGRIRQITSSQGEGHQLRNYMGGTPMRDATPLSIEGSMPSDMYTEWGLLRILPGDKLILATDGITGSTYRHSPNQAWWRKQMNLNLGAQALAHHLVRASPRIDDSTAIVVAFGEQGE